MLFLIAHQRRCTGIASSQGSFVTLLVNYWRDFIALRRAAGAMDSLRIA